MKALVTGGNGFLGGYIIERLLKEGWEVASISRSAAPNLAAMGVETIQGSVADAEAMNKAAAGRDAVFHVAAHVGMNLVWDPFYQTNVVGTRNVINACTSNNVPKLVYTSSPSVVFDGKSHEMQDETSPYPEEFLAYYPQTKAIAEREALAANGRDGLYTCSLRPHLVWGPKDTNLLPRLIERAKKGKVVMVGDGENLVSNAYVENVADAHYLAAMKLGEDSPVSGSAYFIAQKEPVKLWGWIDEILEGLGLPRPKRRVSLKAAYTIGSVLEFVYAALRLKGEPVMTRFMALQFAVNHTLSVEKAMRELGWAPAIGHEEGMRRLIEDFKGKV